MKSKINMEAVPPPLRWGRQRVQPAGLGCTRILCSFYALKLVLEHEEPTK